MQIFFRKGYIVYKEKGKGDFTFVAPHSGPALEIPTSRDDNSETVASLCWMKTGGTLVMSTMPRKRALGIDFNRGIPKRTEAVELFSQFMEDESPRRLYDFRNKYAWTAHSEDDHRKRIRIYQSFWNEVRTGSTIALIHAAFNRLKLIPSIMDLSTFDSRGVDRDALEKAVKEVNSEYSSFLREVEKPYKAVVLLEEERVINNILRVSDRFGLDDMNPDFLENVKADLEAMKKYVTRKDMDSLQENFTPRNFLMTCKKALVSMETPRVTVEHYFRASKSIAPKKQLLSPKKKGRIVMNLECSRFINFWHPHTAAEMIVKILERVRELS